MAEIKPQFLDTLSYAAKFDRQRWRDFLTEGIIGIDDLKVTELDTPGMGIKSAKGRAYVQGDQSEWQGHYGITNDASKNLTIAASDPTNPRKDRIVAQVYDSVDIGGALDKWALEVLTGTPAASPVVPDLPDDALDLAIVDVGAGVTEITNANITDQRSQIELQNVTTKSWIPTGEAWTYVSWDVTVKTGVITVPSGAANKYSSGMKIKITQTTGGTKYGIITKVADTALTVYFGTDYTLNNEAITSPYYSVMKAPLGFPLDPLKWSVKVTDTTQREQATPTGDTWYNLGSISISIPIGSWNVAYRVIAMASKDSATTMGEVYTTLSTANNSESDSEFSSMSSITGPTGNWACFANIFIKKPIILTAKTTYYINTMTKLGTTIRNENAKAPLVIRAVCAYL